MTRLALLCLLGGCFGNQNGGPTCDPNLAVQIDTGATLTYTVGVDAGYYLSYATGGHWHFEWTCDTKLSAYGCDFHGTILADTPAAGVNATCFQCEPAQDELSTAPDGTQTDITFDTLTSTGVDGVDFDSVPGHGVNVDVLVNGEHQDDLVFIPSNGGAVSPACTPVELLPSSP
jgi:hypothetical protein